MSELYQENIDGLYKKINSNINGLSNAEALKKLDQNGENKLTERPDKSNLFKFFSQFNDFMIMLLIGAAIFSAIVSYIRHESYIDSIIILLIVIVNATLSFIQEKKADVAVLELNKMFITQNTVIRDGKKILVDAKDIVVGDIVELKAGDYISADARIISSASLEIDESTLTGESKAIKKDNNIIKKEVELYERKNMVYAGCNVVNGTALVLVVATGMDTELGLIATSLMDKKSELTPLQKRVNQISRVLTYGVLVVIIAMIIIGILMGNDLFDVLMLSIALAVAAIPEGLSSIITINLSLSMSQMAKKNVIVRKMASVETLGGVDIICSDKTGTITQNKMLVRSIYVNNKLYNETDKIADADTLFKCANLCNNTVKNGDLYLGDETEVAIYKYLETRDINLDKINLKRVKELPFDSDRKMMSVIYEENSYTKGSLDSILANSSHYLENGKKHKITDEFRNKILQVEVSESAKSLRLLGFAYKEEISDNPETDMVFLGIMGMMDPPRDTVLNAISTCRSAGIKPIMITGDSIKTAVAIAKEVNIIDNSDRAIQGKDLDKMTDDELMKVVQHYQVYARITPATKLRIVEALQSLGLVVAMTGDGVNDAPAIQKADIGIGMGITGTEVVKKIADCILIDDSFSTIVDGVEEGRRISSNFKKIILYILTSNIIQVILVFTAMLLNLEILGVLQLLWINLVTEGIPAIMLAFEKPSNDIMDNDPANRSNNSFFTPFITARIMIGATLKSTLMFIVFLYYVNTADVMKASSLVFILLIVQALFFAYSCRNPRQSVINKNIFSNNKLNLGILGIILINIIVFSSGISGYFIVDSIGIKDIAVILGISTFVFIIGELLKPLYAKAFRDYEGEPNEKRE